MPSELRTWGVTAAKGTNRCCCCSCCCCSCCCCCCWQLRTRGAWCHLRTRRSVMPTTNFSSISKLAWHHSPLFLSPPYHWSWLEVATLALSATDKDPFGRLWLAGAGIITYWKRSDWPSLALSATEKYLIGRRWHYKLQIKIDLALIGRR